MTRNQWAAVGAIIGVLFVTLACESTTITPGAPTPTPGAYPPSVVDTAHQATVEAVQVERYLNAIEAEDTLRQYHAQATATAEAHALAIWEATATAEAHRVAVTATADAQRFEATATASAEQDQARRDAATATAIAQQKAEERAAVAWQGTATADAMQSQQTATAEAIAGAVTATAEAQRFSATSTAEAIAIEATATASAHQAQREAAESAAAIRQAELATRREELIYPLKAYGPWALVVLLAGLFAFAAIRFIKTAEVRARAIRRDARGDAPLLAFPNGRGGMLVYDPDRSFGPVAVLDGEVSMPALVDEDQQAAVTMRDQAVDLATRGVASPPRKRSPSTRRRQAQRLAMTGAPPQVQVIPPTKVAAWLREVRPKTLAMTIEDPNEVKK